MFLPGINRNANPFDLFDFISEKVTNLSVFFGGNPSGPSINNDSSLIDRRIIASGC